METDDRFVNDQDGKMSAFPTFRTDAFHCANAPPSALTV